MKSSVTRCVDELCELGEGDSQGRLRRRELGVSRQATGGNHSRSTGAASEEAVERQMVRSR